ncbi:MAG: adenylate/guanylate cyclase, partial [Rhizobacter sp.]|nr:adenylate/guanylate cyclase [Chlorobiales bacterium]
AGGLLERSETHLERLAEMALEMQREMDDYDGGAVQLKVRIGMHCGAAVAGVIGTEKLLYDLWGDAVNTAARMESHGVAGEIHLSEAAARRLQLRFLLAERGEMEVKGKGTMTTYFLLGKK